MAEEIKDANISEDPSSSLEGAIASSPEAVEEAKEVTQTPTAEQGVTQPEPEKVKEETPFHEHPRWKEKQAEVEFLRSQVERLAQQPSPPSDPYQGKTPEEKVFWQEIDARAEAKAKQIMQNQVNPQIQQGIQEIARMRVDHFRKDHPDIKTDSPEETQIAEKIRSGYLPEDAYRAVMWDSKVAGRQQETQQRQQQQLEAKKRANVVSSQSVSPQSVAPPKESFMDEVTRRMRTENITFDE